MAKDGLPLQELDIPRRGFYLWLSKQREPLWQRAVTAYTAYEDILELLEKVLVPAQKALVNARPNLIKSRF